MTICLHRGCTSYAFAGEWSRWHHSTHVPIISDGSIYGYVRLLVIIIYYIIRVYKYIWGIKRVRFESSSHAFITDVLVLNVRFGVCYFIIITRPSSVIVAAGPSWEDVGSKWKVSWTVALDGNFHFFKRALAHTLQQSWDLLGSKQWASCDSLNYTWMCTYV